ncbi:TonB-dependent receptor plug domain-containing protein [Hymenobacter terrenus]|uniref:TonB-dependent receptor plug domain-containing protein n=1 Tax=Hymenobacter terrenus TaxID=1629124 RepID=UPI0009E32121|nr:TonB-dependent receptor plug domain-containing protein [Hymenobacter terrenus]
MVRLYCGSPTKPSTQPLFVVDGQPTEDEKVKMLSPNDIDKMEVLKDIEASALYGARAASGAIIITTKK